MLILLYTLYSDVVGIGISVTVLYTIQYQCYYKVYCWTLLVSHSYNKSDEFLVNAIEHARVSQSLSFLHQSDSMQVHPECMHLNSSLARHETPQASNNTGNYGPNLAKCQHYSIHTIQIKYSISRSNRITTGVHPPRMLGIFTLSHYHLPISDASQHPNCTPDCFPPH